MSTNIKIETGFSSEAGIKSQNHDSCGTGIPSGTLLAEKGIIAAIADGMSTSSGAKEASETCVKSLLNDYLDTPPTWTVKTAVSRVLAATNRWLCAQGSAQYNENLGMVSTLSGIIFKKDKAHLFHIGDSRIYLLRHKNLKQLTTDHVNSDGSLAQAMGASIDLSLDYKSTDILEADTFVFTTDGIHGYLSHDDMIDTLTQDLEVTTKADLLTKKALAAGSTDNVTCLLVNITEMTMTETNSENIFLPFPPALESKMILEGYKIIRELHASNRSQLYLAEDTETGDIVALKTPSVNFEDNQQYIDAFERESWIGRKVNSPHIVSTRPNREDQKFLYTVLDHIEGQTLSEWMHDNPNPDLSKVRDIINQLTSGLRTLHRKEIIHQDLKPDNVMMTKSGTCVIIDFGSAKSMGLEESTPIVDTEHGIGTVNYSAPEMLLGYPTNTYSDQYSLATIAYELLAGHLPYEYPLTSDRRVKQARYISISDHRDDIPFWVDRAIKQALSTKLVDRYDALSAFVHDLSFPNPKFKVKQMPLIERNPIAFWKGLSLILAIVLLISLIK